MMGRTRMNIDNQSGMTLVELIVTVAILGILAAAAVPVTRFEVQREREKLLHAELRQMRDAIDSYKSAADRGAIIIKVGTFGYPPDLDTLVNGIEVQNKKVKFLRSIPVDPMTGKAEWGLRSLEDDATSESWGGQNVFDVYSTSSGTGLNGTRYSDW
jgi:general secretion pathway protein G